MVEDQGNVCWWRRGIDDGVAFRLPEQCGDPVGARLLHVVGDLRVAGLVLDTVFVDARGPDQALRRRRYTHQPRVAQRTLSKRAVINVTPKALHSQRHRTAPRLCNALGVTVVDGLLYPGCARRLATLG
jgi:hypothetical protein